MDYLADTVALIRHFSNTGKIGKTARQILEKADQGVNTIWISVISIAEIMYLSEHNRIDLNLASFCKMIESIDNYRVLDLNLDIVLKASQIEDLELHDRLIVASAKYMEIPILTSDRQIENQVDLEVIWA